MAARLERADQVGRKSLLDRNFVWPPLMMHAWLGDRLCDRQLAVDDVYEHLQHGRDDAAAARRTGDEKRFTVLEHDRRRHRRERPLTGPRRVGVAADETKGIGSARL